MKTLKIERKIDSTHLKIEELKNWVGKKVDIIIREKRIKPECRPGSAAGILSDFKNPKRMKRETEGWTKAVRKKHGVG